MTPRCLVTLLFLKRSTILEKARHHALLLIAPAIPVARDPQSQPLSDVCRRLYAGEDGALSPTELAGAESQLLEVLRRIREARAEAARAPTLSTIAAFTAFYNLDKLSESARKLLPKDMAWLLRWPVDPDFEEEESWGWVTLGRPR